MITPTTLKMNTTTTTTNNIDIENIENDIVELTQITHNICSHLYKNDEQLKQHIVVLETEMVELKTEIVELKTEIVELKTEIVELKKETVELKKEIVELKKENVELKKEIVELKKEIVELKKENMDLKKKNRSLTERITILELNQTKSKILTSLADLNHLDQLEKILEIPFNVLIRRARMNRNNISHYIYTEDTAEICDRKKWFLLCQLKKFTDEEKTMLDVYFKNKEFINRIIAYLENLHIEIEPDEDEDDCIRDWWGDM